MINIESTYLNIYKHLCYSHLKTILDVNNKELFTYQLQLFDDDYDTVDALNTCVNFCVKHNIGSIDDILNLLINIINSNKSFFAAINAATNDMNTVMPQKLVPNDMKFAKLDSSKTYLSIDLKHAFSQYIDSLHVLPKKFDELLIDILPDYLKENKTIRVFIYHQCISYIYNDNILYKLLSVLNCNHDLINKLNEYKLQPASYNVDEIVFDITDYVDEFTQYVGLHNINDYNVNVAIFIPHRVTYINPENNKECKVDIKYNIITKKNYFAQRTCKYMCQIYKAYKNLPLCDYDLYVPKADNPNEFYKMSEPIKIISVE